MTTELSSESLRRNGNEHFRLAKATPTHEVNQKRRLLWSALDCYKAALCAASNNKDRSMCWKNSAVMHKELAIVEWSEDKEERAWHHTLECVDSYGEAERHASRWQGCQAWSQDLLRQFGLDLELLFSLTLHQSSSEKFVKNQQLLCQRLGRTSTNCTEYLQVAVNIFADLANRLLHLSISLEERHSNFALAYKYIAEMHFPVQEAMRLASRDQRLSEAHEGELKVLADDQRVQELLFHSRVDLQHGKEFLANLDFDVNRWTKEAELAIDHLKGALLHIVEEFLDVALEAEICCVLGHAYFSLFNLESTAEKYLKRGVELVLCFLADTSRHCRNERWFSTAESDLRDIQKRRAAREEDEKLHLKMSDTLKAVANAAAKGTEHFLTFVYATHPPKAGLSKPPEIDDYDYDARQKKRLMQALRHYHPDKCDREDRKLVILHEEITKHLNQLYMKFK